MRDLARTFAALADPTRLEMLALLLEHEELCVCDFVGSLGISQSKASRHLRYLRNAGLLDDRPQGLWVYYRVPRELEIEGETIIGMLRSVFVGRDLSSLHERYERWVERKEELRCKAGRGPTAARVETARTARPAEGPPERRSSLRRRGGQPRRPAARG